MDRLVCDSVRLQLQYGWVEHLPIHRSDLCGTSIWHSSVAGRRGGDGRDLDGDQQRHCRCAAAVLAILLATAASFHLSTAAVMMILGVDALIDMGRTGLNVIGNCLASAVIDRWENGVARPTSPGISSGLSFGRKRSELSMLR